jgi:hypothetical protein
MGVALTEFLVTRELVGSDQLHLIAYNLGYEALKGAAFKS